MELSITVYTYGLRSVTYVTYVADVTKRLHR
jgi:hypothetical protein